LGKLKHVTKTLNNVFTRMVGVSGSLVRDVTYVTQRVTVLDMRTPATTTILSVAMNRHWTLLGSGRAEVFVITVSITLQVTRLSRRHLSYLFSSYLYTLLDVVSRSLIHAAERNNFWKETVGLFHQIGISYRRDVTVV